MASGTGSLAEYTVASSAGLVKKPKSVSWEDAAGLGIAVYTTYHNLLVEGGLIKGKGQRVFIVRLSLFIFKIVSG